MDSGSRPGRHGADDGPSPRGRSLVLHLRQLAGRRPGAASRRCPQRRARLWGTGGGHPRDSRSSSLRSRDATGPGRDGTARRDPRVDLRAGFKEEWHPLSLSTFFSEGWDEAYVRSPEGTNEAPKQNWFGAADGVFVRLNTLNFFYTNHMTTNLGLLLTPLPWAPAKPKTNGNEYFASYNLYLPLNQRLELLIVAPFIASNKTSPTGHYVGNFGDLTVSGGSAWSSRGTSACRRY